MIGNFQNSSVIIDLFANIFIKDNKRNIVFVGQFEGYAKRVI